MFPRLLFAECNGEFLLSVENRSEGVFLAGTSSYGADHTTVAVLQLSGHYLPSTLECGDGNFRCKQLLTVNDADRHSFVVFVPLYNALLLAEFVSNYTEPIALDEYHLINLTNFNCSPIASFKILNSIYTVCLNLENSYLTLFEVRLDTESLTRTFIVGPLAQGHFDFTSNSGISEFIYVELYRFHFIYFAYANHLYYFEPLNYVLDYAGELHPNCSSVRELVYVGDDNLIAYCREGATVHFDVAYQYWTSYQPYSAYGRPYTCPGLNNIHVVVFEQPTSYVQLSPGLSGEGNIVIELIGGDFVSGKCFGQAGGFYFAYVDQREGTFVLDLTTFNFTQLSTQSCSTNNQNCNTIQVFGNRYLVVQQQSIFLTERDPPTVNSVGSAQHALTLVFDSQRHFNIVTAVTINTTEVDPATPLIQVIETTISCSSIASDHYPTMSNTNSDYDLTTTDPHDNNIFFEETTTTISNNTTVNDSPYPTIAEAAVYISVLMLIMLLVVMGSTVMIIIVVLRTIRRQIENVQLQQTIRYVLTEQIH